MFKLHLHCKWWDLHHNNRLYGRILSDANLRWGLSSCPLGTGTWLPVLVGKRSSWEGYRQFQRICPSFRFRKVYPTWFRRKIKNRWLAIFRHSFPLEADRLFPTDDDDDDDDDDGHAGWIGRSVFLHFFLGSNQVLTKKLNDTFTPISLSNLAMFWRHTLMILTALRLELKLPNGPRGWLHDMSWCLLNSIFRA